MILGVLLIVLGLSLVALSVGWRSGYWLASARTVMQWVSPPMVVATPAAGLLVASVGVMLLWPPAVILAFASALGWVAVLALSARRGTAGRLPPGLRGRAHEMDGDGRATPQGAPSPPPDTRTSAGTPGASSPPRRPGP